MRKIHDVVRIISCQRTWFKFNERTKRTWRSSIRLHNTTMCALIERVGQSRKSPQKRNLANHSACANNKLSNEIYTEILARRVFRFVARFLRVIRTRLCRPKGNEFKTDSNNLFGSRSKSNQNKLRNVVC